ncbi:MAG: hypothetical protein ABIK68_19385 [bacterium]
MKIVLDEQDKNDTRIVVDEIDLVFKKKDKLYVHKCTIDFDPSQPEKGLQSYPGSTVFRTFGSANANILSSLLNFQFDEFETQSEVDYAQSNDC